METKIILAKMPRYYESYFTENSESLALDYLTSYLRNHGFKVIIFDSSIEALTFENAKERLLTISKEHNPLLIGFTIADMTFIESTIETVKFLKNHGISSHMTMGGHSPTFNYKEIFKLCPQLDSIVRFEGEEALLRLAKSLLQEDDWRSVPNIAYRENGKTIANPPLPLIENLDEIPVPSRDYTLYVLSNLSDIGVVPILISRGCYMNCSFCSIRNFYGFQKGRLWRSRSTKNIVEEIIFLKGKFPDIKEIVILDDAFTGPSNNRIQRMLEFKEELLKHNPHLMFSIADRVDIINDVIGKLWREIGVRQILLGFESGSHEILDKFNKGITIEDQRKALDILEKYEIDTTISFINFTPWSTIEQIEKNVKYFLSLKINMIQGMLNRLQIYDGTPIAGELKKEGLLYGDFPNVSYHSLDERVDRLYEIINKSFNPYLFIAYRLKILERELRMSLFDAEINRDEECIAHIKEYKKMYREMMQTIMTEAVAQFLLVLESVKNGVEIDEYFMANIKEKVMEKSNEWFKMIEWFRIWCPALNQQKAKEVFYGDTG